MNENDFALKKEYKKKKEPHLGFFLVQRNTTNKILVL